MAELLTKEDREQEIDRLVCEYAMLRGLHADDDGPDIIEAIWEDHPHLFDENGEPL